jgi:hypothetical protein
LTEGSADEPAGLSWEERAERLDITAIRDTDTVVEALSARRSVLSGDDGEAPSGAARDPAVLVLQALIEDVDEGAPPLPARRPAPSGRRPSRFGSRTVVALGVTGAMLATTGVAAAAGGLGDPFGRPPAVVERAQVPRTDPRSRMQDSISSSVRGPRAGDEGTPEPRRATGRQEAARPRRGDGPASPAPRGSDLLRTPLRVGQDHGGQNHGDEDHGDENHGDENRDEENRHGQGREGKPARPDDGYGRPDPGGLLGPEGPRGPRGPKESEGPEELGRQGHKAAGLRGSAGERTGPPRGKAGRRGHR